MAMTAKERSIKSALKREAAGEVELRHRIRKGEKDMLLELMSWTSDKEQGSAIAGCLRHVHSLGRDGAIEALRSRHVIEVSANVAADIYVLGQRKASRLDAEEA
ncbi:hypothetical protein [Pseudomonas sp. CCI2.4]|uniref:hypothetical protein n=1 Tax=Pseudomonas sp. CCI2.4 TaxID=3048617 RepID=UPI002B238E1E|nr:hypothetical protein [Pseudomonas sp. CCI2.4]MEB0133413.1 hypothetical protein [Pseudomonas sp. CCI2.4]